MQIVNLNHVLNLVRHQAQKHPAVNDPFPMTEERALALIESAALLIGRACRAPSEMLTRISDHATRCQSHRQMDTHCGACQEYDKAHACDLNGQGERGDTCAA
jgi:hypothetical protein